MAWVPIATATLSGNSHSLLGKLFTPIVSVHQAGKLVSVLFARVTADLAESNVSLPPGLRLTSHAG